MKLQDVLPQLQADKVRIRRASWDEGLAVAPASTQPLDNIVSLSDLLADDWETQVN